MIAGADETCFDRVGLVMMDLVSGYRVLEEAADHKTYGTWQERTQAAITKLGLELRYVVSDRAKASIKLALKGPPPPNACLGLRSLTGLTGWWSGWPPCPCPESQEHPQNLTH